MLGDQYTVLTWSSKGRRSKSETLIGLGEEICPDEDLYKTVKVLRK